MRIFSLGFLLLLVFHSNFCFGDFIVVKSTYTPLTTLDIGNSSSLNNTTARVDTELSTDTGFEHAETFGGNAWLGELSSTTSNNYVEYHFDVTSPVLVERISFWNITDVSDFFKPGGGYETNEGGTPTPTTWTSNAGLNEYKLFSSTNGGSTWSEIYQGKFDAANSSDTYIDTDYPSNPSLFFAREQHASILTPFLANSVKIELLSNHSGLLHDRIGLAKVNFFSASSVAVPEPTSLCLFGGSIILASVYRKFRRPRNV